ncbi:MAG: class I SAM-dependent methyltransferase [Senegalia sp. (in: firmicutes)]
MDYFDSISNAKEYIKMAEGIDGTYLVNIFKKHLKKDSSVLELGMGPGKDLDELKKCYKVVGSDKSKAFLDLYSEENKDIELLLLDAKTLKTDKKFDGIYSNKVLIHLDKEELKESINRQYNILNEGGLALHSFWKGNSEEIVEGLKFVYYEKGELLELFSKKFKVVDVDYYTEMEYEDSIYIIVKKT